MSRQTLEVNGHEKLVGNKFGIATQYILVATRTRLLQQNFFVTLSKSIAIEFKKELREQVVTEDYMLRQRLGTKTENSIVTELSMLR